MNDAQSYEKIVKAKNEGKLLLKKIALITVYVMFAAIGVTLAILLADGHPALILLVALLDFCLWLLTHRFVEIEYEYTFVSGTFYLSKIMGKASRKELYEEEISKAVTIAPYNNNYKAELKRHELKNVYHAISSKNAQNVWFILFEGEGDTKDLVILEADEKMLKCLRKYAPRSLSREKLTKTINTTEDTNNA